MSGLTLQDASPPTPPDPAAPTERAVMLAADTIGDIMGFWNFKPSMGKVWTVLYLSRSPLSADEIELRTGLSSGMVNMAIQELLQWQVIRKAWAPGERRRRYEAETDVVSMVTRVFRERELRMIDEMVGRLEQAMHILESEGLSSVPDQMMHRRFVATRVGLLLNLARAGRLVVEQLGRAGTFDLGTIRHTLRR
jgi:DNA-binding transcriptional regulator GbsR (MarR family)